MSFVTRGSCFWANQNSAFPRMLALQGVFRFHVCPCDNAGEKKVESTGINEPQRLENEARIRARRGAGSKKIVE